MPSRRQVPTVLDPHRSKNFTSIGAERATSRSTTLVADRLMLRLDAPSSVARRITPAWSAVSAAEMSSACPGWIAVGSENAAITSCGSLAIWTALRIHVWLT